MCYVLKKGTTSKLLLVHLRDAADGRSGKTGLTNATPGAAAAYLREGSDEVRAVPLVATRLGEFLPGGLAEVDPELMPGIYQLGIPNAALEGGADAVVLALRFPGTVGEPIAITLVAYDPQDPERIGMSALGPEGRVAALRGAFPRLTAKELAEYVESKRRS
jgi:hypothetical protein